MKGKNCYTRTWGTAMFKFCSEEKEPIKENESIQGTGRKIIKVHKNRVMETTERVHWEERCDRESA